MREIKFRAWDNIQNKMTYSVSVYSELNEAPWWGGNHINPETDNTISSFDNGTIMQYTGLKEIYEGDIVKARYYYQYSGSSSNWEWRTRSGEIRFENYKWILKVGDYEKIKLGDIEDSEIIGNIYENPELIKT